MLHYFVVQSATIVVEGLNIYDTTVLHFLKAVQWQFATETINNAAEIKYYLLTTVKSCHNTPFKGNVVPYFDRNNKKARNSMYVLKSNTAFFAQMHA